MLWVLSRLLTHDHGSFSPDHYRLVTEAECLSWCFCTQAHVQAAAATQAPAGCEPLPWMQGNMLTSTSGLELLPHLLVLDLRFNLVSSLEEIFRLGGARLSSLTLALSVQPGLL